MDKKRKLGFDQGKVWIAEDFDAPLPDHILADFEEKSRPVRCDIEQ
jgi:hypothetical protein